MWPSSDLEIQAPSVSLNTYMGVEYIHSMYSTIFLTSTFPQSASSNWNCIFWGQVRTLGAETQAWVQILALVFLTDLKTFALAILAAWIYFLLSLNINSTKTSAQATPHMASTPLTPAHMGNVVIIFVCFVCFHAFCPLKASTWSYVGSCDGGSLGALANHILTQALKICKTENNTLFWGLCEDHRRQW